MSLKRWLFAVLALLVALSFRCGQLAAQTMTTGGIAGVVTNPKNAVVPNATVTLTSSAKGTAQTTTTSGTGTYQFGLLDPGSYTVTVEMNGFQRISKVVTVPLGQPVMVDFQLSVKAKLPTERVGPSLIETQNGNLDITLTHQQISQVPNPGNDMTYLAQLAPGTIMNTQGGTGNFSNYGMPATSNRFSLNGMDDNEPFVNINNSGATRLLLGTSEVQEVSIVSNGYTGTYGEFAGAAVNYVTSSGGNQLHGNANYTWNSRMLNANDFFNNSSATPRPYDTAHQWSASVGGPLKKNKLFFFFDTEGLRVLIPTSPLVVTPSPQFETATITNLTNSGRTDVANFYQNQIFGTLNSAPNANTALDTQFGGQFTDSSGQGHSTGDGCGAFSLNPTFYNPTLSPGGAFPCALGYRATASNFSHELQFAGRADYIAGAKDRVFVRYQRDMGTQATYTDPINSAFNVQSSLPEDQGQLEWAHSFGPATANQFLVAGQWYSAVFNTANPTSGTFPTTLALADGTFFNTAGPNPCANPPIGQFPVLLGGRDCVNPQGRSTTQVQVSDDLSTTFGRQTIKIGGQFRRVDVSDHDFGTLQSGLLVVNTINDFYNGGATGDTLTQSFPQSLNQPIAYYTAGGYLEDDFRWSKTLSFTVVLRAEHDSNPICRHLCFAQLAAPFNFVAGINCTTATSGQQTCSGNNQAQLLLTPYNQAIKVNQLQALPGLQNVLLQPRFSFAWQPLGTEGKTVVRGGAGIFYNMFPISLIDNFAQNPPNDATFVSTNDFIVPTASANGSSIFFDSTNTATFFQNGFVTGETFGTIQSQDPGFTKGPNLFTSEAQTNIPRYYKWNLEIQRQLGDATSVSIGYVGNRGKHEPIIDNSVNAFGFGTLAVQAPDPRFTGVTTLYAGGSSKYDGGTVTLIHRLNGAWGTGIVQASYTYSHASDQVSNGGVFPFSSTSLLNPQDPFNTQGNYGPADYDARHSVNVNYVWELPIRQLVGARFSNRLTDGWELSGTVFARSGFPYSVVDGTLSSNLAANNNYFSQVIPSFLGGPHTCQVTSAGPSCFANASEFNVGAEPGFSTGQRNIFRGPRYIGADAAVMKFTKIPGWENARLGIGVQAFNVFNHPNFGLPINNAASPNFGEILSTVGSPTSILGSQLGASSSARVLQLKAQFTF